MAFSIGLKSGLYGERECRVAPAALIRSRAASACWSADALGSEPQSVAAGGFGFV